jgi:hypothetical protein
MGVQQDPNTIFTIDSSHGIDGSSAVTAIPDGYCDLMENADISTKGVIKKRPGYGQYGCEFPARVHYNTGVSTVLELEWEAIAVPDLKFIPYNTGMISASLDKYLGYQSTRDLTSTHVLVDWTDWEDYPEIILSTNHMLIGTSTSLTYPSIYPIPIAAVLSRRYFVISKCDANNLRVVLTAAYPAFIAGSSTVDVTAASYQIQLCVGIQPNCVVESDIASVSVNVANTQATIVFASTWTVDDVRYLFPVGSPAMIVGTYNLSGQKVISNTHASRTIVIGCTGASTFGTGFTVVKNYFRMAYVSGQNFKLIRSSGAAVDSTTFRFYISPITLIGSNTASGLNRFMYGLGLNAGRIQSLASYLNLATNLNTLVAANNSNLFREVDFSEFFPTAPTLLADIWVAVAAAVTAGIDGYFDITSNLNNASKLLVGDILTYEIIQTSGSKASVTFTVVEITPSIKVSYLGTTLNLYLYSKINVTRTSRTLPLSGLITGLTLSFNSDSEDTPTYRIISTDLTNAYLDREVTFSSTDTLYFGAMWDLIHLLSSAFIPFSSEYQTGELLDNTSVQSSIAFADSLCHVSSDGSPWRLLGDSLACENIPKPELISIRSIPGTRSNIPSSQYGANARIGEKIDLCFTYSYVDSLGRTYESRSTEPGEVVFTPQAARDGSNYAELVEVCVKAPPTSRGMFYPVSLNVYRNALDPLADAQLNYRLEKTVLTGVPHNKFTFTIGETEFFNPAERRKLYILDEGNNVPAPRCKYLLSAGNRLIGLNISSHPYFIIEPLGVFHTTTTLAGYFKAYASLSVFLPNFPGSAYVAETSNPIPFNDNFQLTLQTMPFGLDPGTGLVVANRAAASGFPAQTAASGFSDFTSFKISLVAGLHVIASPVVVYNDLSQQFYLGLAHATTALKLKLRATSKDFPRGTSIDFLGDVFTRRTDASSSDVVLEATTKWTDENLDAALKPRILNGHSLTAFDFIQAYTAAEVLSKDAYVECVNDNTGSKTYLTFSPSASGVISSLTSKVLVIQGPGRLGGYKSGDDSEILDWESRLTFTSAAASVTGFGPVSRLELTPVRLSNVVGATVVSVVSPIYPSQTVSEPALPGYSMSIFGNTLAYLDVTAVTGFSVPSLFLNIQAVGIGNVTGFPAGDYLNLVLSDADAAKIPSNYPSLDVAMQIDTRISENEIKVRILNSFELWTQAVATSLSFGASSFAVNATKKFAPSYLNTCFLLEFPISGASPSPECGAFLIIRGKDYNSVCMELSGWYIVREVKDGGNTLVLASSFDIQQGIYPDFAPSITSISMSHVIIADTPGVFPVPVPYKLGLAESLSDLALPYFTANPLLTNNPLVQISKRFSAAIGTLDYQDVAVADSDLGLREYIHSSYGKNNGYEIDLSANSFFVLSMVSPNSQKRRMEVYRAYPEIYHNTGTSEIFDSIVFKFRGDPESYQINAAIRPSPGDPFDVTIEKAKADYVATTFTYRVDNYPNAFVWTAAISSSIINNFIPTFKQDAYHDLGSQDGTQLTGGTPFQSQALMFKSNSIYAVTFGEALLDYTVKRLQTTVGAFSHYNLPVTDSYCYFLHDTGPHYTDGVNVEPMFKLNKVFDEYTIKDRTLFSLAAGYTDTYSKNVYLGAPYVSPYSDHICHPDAQYNYSYNDGVLGWLVNTRIDALRWVERDGRYYFASTRGFVGKMRTETELTRYNDYDSPIPFALRTRYTPNAPAQEAYQGGEAANIKFKFWRNAIFQFGNTSDFSMAVYYSENYSTTETPLETYNILGADTNGTNPIYGTDRYVKTLRDTLGKRTAQIAFILREESADTDCPIYHISVEGLLLNTRLVPQKDTRSGDR